MSTIRVTGFSCESSELQSPRSSATTERSNSGNLRSPVSLLTVLLSTSGQLAPSDAWDDSHIDDGDDICYSDDESVEATLDEVSTLASSQRSAADWCPTAPVDVPSVMWLKAPEAVNELRKLHYERCVRRIELEQAMQREALVRQAQANSKARAVAHQQQCQLNRHNYAPGLQQGVR